MKLEFTRHDSNQGYSEMICDTDARNAVVGYIMCHYHAADYPAFADLYGFKIFESYRNRSVAQFAFQRVMSELNDRKIDGIITTIKAGEIRLRRLAEVMGFTELPDQPSPKYIRLIKQFGMNNAGD